MGNLLFRSRKRSSRDSNTVVRRGVTSVDRSQSNSFSSSFDKFPQRNQNYPFPASNAMDSGEAKKTASSAGAMAPSSSGLDKKKKYAYIPDNFTSIDQVLSLGFFFSFKSLVVFLFCICFSTVIFFYYGWSSGVLLGLRSMLLSRFQVQNP